VNAMLREDLYSSFFNYVERRKFAVLRSRNAESFGKFAFHEIVLVKGLLEHEIELADLRICC